MYLCYIDESGTPDIPGNTSHYILAGVSIPVQYWKDCDNDIENIKSKYGCCCRCSAFHEFIVLLQDM
ncbi:MAG: DUF3800 domain-containing protein [Candidatus Latescibacter sp.]|nr:DUF3800 domain-containing protein [Candidatus Latescibacter sp.]